MKFSFSKNFRLPLYAQLLQEVAAEIDTYRELAGINVTDMMTELHISHPTLKKY